MTATTKLSERQHAFTTEALMVRALGVYREARDDALRHGVDVSDAPEPPTFAALRYRYDNLLDEWAGETPSTISNMMEYLDLVAAIIAGELENQRSDDKGGPVSTERDFGFALELLTGARRWLNEQDISDLIAEERSRFAAGKGATPLIAQLDEADLSALIAEYRRLHTRAKSLAALMAAPPRSCGALRSPPWANSPDHRSARKRDPAPSAPRAR